MTPLPGIETPPTTELTELIDMVPVWGVGSIGEMAGVLFVVVVVAVAVVTGLYMLGPLQVVALDGKAPGVSSCHWRLGGR